MTYWPADDVITCSQCDARSHDAVEEKGRKTLLVCNFCGLGEWTYNAPKRPADRFHRMESGRYEGMTLDEIDKLPNGRRYIEALKETKLSEVVFKYLAALQ